MITKKNKKNKKPYLAPINHLLSGLQCLKLWLYMKAKKPSRIFLKRSLPRPPLLEYWMVNIIYILCFAMFLYLLILFFIIHWFVSLDPPFDLNLPGKYWRKTMYWFLRIMALEIGDLARWYYVIISIYTVSRFQL